jgi:uroporphyrinogen-III synthase
MSPANPMPDEDPPGAHGAGGVRPLRVAVTRPSAEDRLGDLLRGAGHTPVHFPLTRILPPRDPRPLERSARALLRGEFDVLLLTSARAVQPLVRALESESATRGSWRRPEGLQVWVIGDATGDAAAAAGFAPDRMPERFVAEALVEEASSWGPMEGLRVLFPRAAVGRSLIPERLAGDGARVTLVEAYHAVDDLEEADRLLRAIGAADVDAVTLSAGSQARVLGQAMRESHPTEPCLVPFVVIGPATREAVRAAGLPDPSVAEPHTLEGLVAAVNRVAGGLQ